MKHLSLILSLALGLIAVAARAERAPSPAVAAALKADAARLQAQMAGDAKALADLLSDDLIFVHSDGRSESKADYVKNLLAGDTAYAGMRTSQIVTRENSAESVVVLGVLEMRKRLGPDWSDVKLHFMAVWRNENGAWRMLAWLSARPAGNSVPPRAK